MAERVIETVPGLVRGQKRDGRAKYDPVAKAELVRRCREPGVSVAGLALAHGLNANLLRKWITQDERRGPRAERAALLPVTVRPELAPALRSVEDGAIELVLPGGTIRIRGRVDAAALSTVIDCLARRA